MEADEAIGSKLEPMEPYRFLTAIEAICTPFVERTVKGADGQRHTEQVSRTMPIQLSRATLASPDFLEQLRTVHAFNTVRLPVRRRKRVIELLPEGIDESTGTLTLTPAGDDWTLKHGNRGAGEAVAYVRELLSEFCFCPADRERSLAVAVAAMLTLFCRHVLRPNEERPAFVYTANAEGSGKTLLAKLANIPLLGYAPVRTVPKEESEIRKLVLAAVLGASPVSRTC